MKSTSGGWVNLVIVWAVASAAGAFAMVALMVVGDWGLVQAIFAAAVVFVVLGTVLALLFLKPLPGPQQPGTAGKLPGTAGSAAKAAPAPPPAQTAEPAQATAPVAPTAPAAAPAALSTPAPAMAATPGTRPEALSAPRGGTADDLKRIKGIGPKLEKLCNSLGFYHFDQIAGWTADEVAWVDQNLEGFKGRVLRDNWVEQAKTLASGG